MTFFVDETARRDALQIAARRPVAGFDPGGAERFKADFAAMQSFSNLNAQHRNASAAQADFQTRFFHESGQRLPGWIDSMNFNAKDVAQKQFDDWKAANPDSDLKFPTDEDIQRQVVQRAASARSRSETLAERSDSWASAVGGFLGTAAGAMTDPVNLLSMGFGAGPAAGVVRTALTEAAIGGVSQGVIELGSRDFKRQVDPGYSASDAMNEILGAAAGGAILGGGLRGIAALWERAAGRTWPRNVRDAANIVSREASVPKSRLDQSAYGSSVHRAALEKAADDIVSGRPVEIPQEAFLQAQARPGRVYDADGRSVGVTYEVVDADSLVTSHGDDLAANPAFPAELQPRDRTRAISRDQIQAIAGNLQPERLGPSPQAESGAPIVGADGLVESGNARVIALRRAYQDGGVPADNYRAFLRSQNYDIAGIDKPVLVARRVTDLSPEERIGFVTAANRSTALRLGAAEQALADARLIDDAVLSKLEGSDVDALANRDFVRGFMRKLPRAEQGELVDRAGVLSQTGERRLIAALMGRAYGEPVTLGRALEDTDSNIRALAGALADAAPAWARLRDAVARGEIPRGMDVTGDLLEAVRLIAKARDEGRSVADLVHQAEMFGGPNEIAKIFARAMFGDAELKRPASRKKIAAFLADFAEEARKNDVGPRLFGEPLEAPDVLRSSLARAGRQDLERVALDRLTPKAVEDMAVSDDALNAAIVEAERMAGTHVTEIRVGGEMREVREKPTMPGLMVDLGDGPRPLSEILDEADEEIAAAAHIEACVAGAPNADLGT